MIAIIKVWSLWNLSYTVRMQLINSVLLSLHMYWSQIYILPKKVLHDVTKVCRAFLWSGHAYSHNPSNIVWIALVVLRNMVGLASKMCLHGTPQTWWSMFGLLFPNRTMFGSNGLMLCMWKMGIQPTTSASWYWKKISATKGLIKMVYTQAEFTSMPQCSCAVNLWEAYRY